MSTTRTPEDARLRATTVVAVRGRDGSAAVACDGQVTQGAVILKRTAVKVRALRGGRVLAGVAGSAGDALSLFELFEEQLEKYRGDLQRAAVELARTWRSDKVLRRLDAVLLVVDRHDLLIVSGTGDVVAPDEPFAAVGSGAGYAVAALKAMYERSDSDAAALARRALTIASELCIYTNDRLTVLELGVSEEAAA